MNGGSAAALACANAQSEVRMSLTSRAFRAVTNSPSIRRIVLQQFWRQIRRDSRRGPTNDQHLMDFLGVAAQHAALGSSKAGQDLWVAYETKGKRDGFFVEFGAENGLRGSNTLMFESHYGWRGILAEPNPLWADTFKKIGPSPFIPLSACGQKAVTRSPSLPRTTQASRRSSRT